MKVLSTSSLSPYSVKFSVHSPNLIGVACGENFGILGSGALLVFDFENTQSKVAFRTSWTDALFDLTWCENSFTDIVTASGDGSLQLWNASDLQNPLTNEYKEHTKEVVSVEWSQAREGTLFVSASWDKTVKVWDALSKASVISFSEHDALVYQAAWSPLLPGTVASVSGDGNLRLWDTSKGCAPCLTINAHNGEVLTVDWCKYNSFVLATGGTDLLIKGWDTRYHTAPLFCLSGLAHHPEQMCLEAYTPLEIFPPDDGLARNIQQERKWGHTYPARRLKFSPFHSTKLVSTSYDFSTRIWDTSASVPLMECVELHSEFCYGLDTSNYVEGLVADCSWDQTVHINLFQSLCS